jgi:hypothetical protein
VRVRALKPYKVACPGPYGHEIYSGGPGAVHDVPKSALKRLGTRVEVVPPETPTRGVPLEPFAVVDDD